MSEDKRAGRPAGPPQFLIDATNAVNADQVEEAINILKQGVSVDGFTAYGSLGQIYLSRNENEEALECLKKACEYVPTSATVLVNICEALIRLNRYQQGADALIEVIKNLKRDMRNTRLFLEELFKANDCEETIKIVAEMPLEGSLRKEVFLEIARVLKRTMRLEMAQEWYTKVLENGPDIIALRDLGRLCQSRGRLSEAVQYMQKGREAYPDIVGFSHDLGNYLTWVGRFEEGISNLRKGLEAEPGNASIRSDLLLQMHYQQLDRQKLFAEHRQWGQIHAPVDKARKSHKNTPDPDRSLRIGYISSDFFRHSAAYFFESILDGHDRSAVGVYGYGNVDIPDQTTERLKTKFDRYRDIRGLDDKAVVDLIERDEIDILIELSCHTAGNRLSVLACKPAPIQVTYLGYPDTTGLEQIDYRLTDSAAEAEDAQQFHTEELVFLSNGFLCYRPFDYAPPVAPLPALKNGFVTFGSFNNNKKVNPEIMALWAKILKANDKSRLLLKFLGGDDEDVRDYHYRHFEQLGISPERVEILGRKSPLEHLELYGQVDIALDTYPYNGTTTTCEALWMGVPVVSLFGEHHASRVGRSILTRLSLESLVVSSAEDYVEKAVSLAQDTQALAELRDCLRGKMLNSSLCNADGFASGLEEAYRQMWHMWCQAQGVEVADDIVVNDIRFRNVRKTRSKSNSFGFSDKYVIKIEHHQHPWKLRTFSEEVEIIKHLNSAECVSCPGLFHEGTLKNGRKYFIQQRVDSPRPFNAADLVFSILEQKSFGVCQGDFKVDNFKFSGDSVCSIIDYDQAIYDERFAHMGNVEYLEWFDQFFVNRWKKLGFNFTDIYTFAGLDKDEVLGLFRNDSFNLGATSIFKEQITTNTQSGIYHSLNSDKIYIEGARNLNPRLGALDTIEFKKGEKVLDVGCNMGLLGHYLHDRGCDVTGIDMDKKIVVGAKMVANVLGKKIRFNWLDLDLGKIDEDYDTICLFSVIHHVKNFYEVTENISQRCNRIILECSLKEAGAKPVDGKWTGTTGWNFSSREELAASLEKVFKGFKFQKYHGNVDRSREILTFVKQPAAVGIEL